MIDYYEPNLDLTLTGCGFLGIYYIGAVNLLSQIWPHKPYNRICGSSCGGWVSKEAKEPRTSLRLRLYYFFHDVIGVLLVAGIPLEGILAEMSDLLKRPKLFNGGSCSLIEIVQGSLGRVLPQDAHKICTDKLGLSITKLSWSLENKFIHQFESREELIQAVVAGCYIPIWAGLSVPKFRGQKCLDGAYSDNTPKFELKNNEQIRQVELCPFSSEIEVSPPDECRVFMCKIMGTRYVVNWNNSIRTKQAVIPWSPTSYRQLLSDGHRDMKEFVFKNNLVKCRNCYLKTTRQKQQQTEVKSVDRSTKESPCLACLKLLEKVDSLRVPERLFKMMK